MYTSTLSFALRAGHVRRMRSLAPLMLRSRRSRLDTLGVRHLGSVPRAYHERAQDIIEKNFCGIIVRAIQQAEGARDVYTLVQPQLQQQEGQTAQCHDMPAALCLAETCRSADCHHGCSNTAYTAQSLHATVWRRRLRERSLAMTQLDFDRVN
eukprot:scaffold946_cov415-Prasinococcus_capsulatus_cf.AAC.10